MRQIYRECRLMYLSFVHYHEPKLYTYLLHYYDDAALFQSRIVFIRGIASVIIQNA